MPGELKEAIRAFIQFYNYQRYHEGSGNVTPCDFYTGRHLAVSNPKKEGGEKQDISRQEKL